MGGLPVCFFRVAEGADLGWLVLGRKGQQTRFELAEDDARAFIDSADLATSCWTEGIDDGSSAEASASRIPGGVKLEPAPGRGNRVFITDRMNKKIMEQVQELVAFGKFDPVVAHVAGEHHRREPSDIRKISRASRARARRIATTYFCMLVTR
jgi:hypothetical protein